MDKVIAFLEKYAQYLALGIAVAFLGYITYSSVLSNPKLDIKVPSVARGVGPQVKAPGDVDAAIAANDARVLVDAAKATASDEVKKQFTPPTFDKEFTVRMGAKRPNVEFVGIPTAPGQPLLEQDPTVPEIAQEKIAGLVKPPAAEPKGAVTGQSFLAVAAPLPPFALVGNAAAGAVAPVVPPAPAAGVPVAGFDATWVTVEFTLDLQKLAAAWDASFLKKDGKPIDEGAPRKTQFLWVEVQREELVGANQWSKATIIKPLPLTQIAQAEPDWLKLVANPGKDLNAEEAYRVWSEKGDVQINLVEPPFYQVLGGDPWGTPSVPPPPDPAAAAGDGAAAAAAAAANAPFDPAAPPNRPLTQAEKQQVYLYQQQQRKEKEKADMADRKAKAAAAEAARKAPRPTGPATPVRPPGGGGGYAPLPLAADEGFGTRGPVPAGAGPRAGGAGFVPGGGRTTPPPAGGVRPPAPGVPGGVRPAVPPPAAPVPGAPAAPFVPNPVLAGPFDPADAVALNPAVPGGPQNNTVAIWAHDTTAQPGKVYRYRVRYYLKNPLHMTHGFFRNQKDASVFAVPSEWSGWLQTAAPQNVHFFFAKRKVPNAKGQIGWVEVDVFKRDKGVWTKSTFQITPGDAVGQIDPTTGVNFATGATLVDLRTMARSEDARILIADEQGNLETRTLMADLSSEFYRDLLNKVAAPPAGPGGVPPAGGGLAPAARAVP